MDLYCILLILYFIFFAVVAVKNLKWALYLIVFGLLSYLIRFKLGWLPMTVLEGMILIVFLVWIIRILKNKDIKKIKQIVLSYKYLFILSGLFLLSATVNMFINTNLVVAAGIWKAYFIEPFLFLIVLITTINKKDIKNIFKIFFWQIILLSLVAIYQKITGNFIANPWWAAEATRRVTSVFAYPNALALYLAPLTIILMGYLVYSIKYLVLSINKKTILLLVYSLLFIISLSVIYFTKSKGALIALVGGIIFYIVFYKGMRKYFLSILLILILLVGYGWQTGKIDLKGKATVLGGDSISVRLDMWQETWQMLKTRPMLGAGLANYQTVIKPYHQKDYIEIYLYPHNIFLNFWSELGLLGLVSFLLILGWFYRVGFKNVNKNDSIILMASMSVILIHGLVDVPYFKNDLSLLWWLIIGMMLIIDYDKIGENKENKV